MIRPMNRNALLTLSLLALPLLSGCRNACQQLCVDIADYALNECGLQFTDEEMDTCLADHAGSELDREEQQACSDAAPHLEEEWDCETLREYFKASGAE